MSWQAKWIWSEAFQTPAPLTVERIPPPDTWNRFCYLRRTFDVDDVPRSVPARVTADSRFILYVNGREVARGPARAVPERIAYEEVDLAPHLQRGHNVVAALARFYGHPNPVWRPAVASHQLGFGSFALEAPAIRLLTDETWKARRAPFEQDVPIALNGIPPEFVDGAAVPHGWTAPNFDDSGWDAAVVLSDGILMVEGDRPGAPPYTRPEPSDIAPLTAIPLDLTRLNATTFDAGRMTLATPWIKVRGATGATVEVSAGEDLRVDGTAESRPRDFLLRYSLRGDGVERLESFDAVGFRYMTIRGDAEVIAVGATERRYPRDDIASFACDDARLNTIWSVGVRTLELCSTDAFLDCPGREQRAWLGDSYIHALLTYVTSTDWRLVRRHLRISAQSRRDDGLLAMAAAGDVSLWPGTIPDYSLHWIRELARYYEHTGDTRTVRELLPTALEIVPFFEAHRQNGDLLHDVRNWVFIDWAQTERAAVIGALNALYAITLDDLASLLAGVLGDAQGAHDLRTKADTIRAAFQVLWDPSRGVYVDAADADGPRRRVSQHTNAMAIVSGCAPADHWRDMLTYILDPTRVIRTKTPGDAGGGGQGHVFQWLPPENFDPERNVVEAQPFFSHFVHQAAAEAGRRDLLLDLCLRWHAQIERGNTTFEEYWNAPPGASSRCHAWSGTPTYDLTTHILGIRPVLPGYTQATIRPFFGPLKRLSGRKPTPLGLIELDLTRAGGTLTVPEGIEADVAFEDVQLGGGRFGPGHHTLT